jgi:hypothetical protein
MAAHSIGNNEQPQFFVYKKAVLIGGSHQTLMRLISNYQVLIHGSQYSKRLR